MKPTTKKYLIAGAIGVVTVAGALAYLQYKKLMNYTLKFKGLRVRKLRFNDFDFDITLDFMNKSNIDFIIEKQVYNVYLNDIFVTKLENISPSTIKANTTSPMALNVKFNPKDVLEKIGVNAVNFVLNANKTILKVDAKLKVKLWFFNINIPYVYQSTLKDMLYPVPEQA
jgi:LEA14-like dessication related protein